MIDTLSEAKKLEDAGFAPEQAAAMVEIQWEAPSWVLRDLQKSGFERKQAEAVLDFYWTVRNENLMKHPMRMGLLSGTAMSLCMFGIFYITDHSMLWFHH
jgi:hypothetical protein